MRKRKTEQISITTLRPSEDTTVTWVPSDDCELNDVTLEDFVGPLDVGQVLIANMLQTAFQRRKRLVRANEYVRVTVKNYGKIDASACTVVIAYTPLFEPETGA